jgi:hypothetical protein
VFDITFCTLRFFPPPPPSADLLAVLPRAFAAALGFFPALTGRVRDIHVVVGAIVPLVLEASELFVADVDTDVPGSALHDASRRWTGMATSRMAWRSRSRPRGSRAVASRWGCAWRMRSATAWALPELATTVPCPWTLLCRSRKPLARRW